MKPRNLYTFLLAAMIFASSIAVDFDIDCCGENMAMMASTLSRKSTDADTKTVHSCCSKDSKPSKCCDKTVVHADKRTIATTASSTKQIAAILPRLGFRQKYFNRELSTTVERPNLPILRPPSGKLPPYILFSQNILYA